MKQKQQIALVPGTTKYRHTYMGETKFANRGDVLPISSSGPGTWEAWVGDNKDTGEREIIVLIDGDPLCCAVMINLPEKHQIINLKGKNEGFYDYNGSYRITGVDIEKGDDDNEYFHIYTIRAGDIVDTKLIHAVRAAGYHQVRVRDNIVFGWRFIWDIKDLILPLTM